MKKKITLHEGDLPDDLILSGDLAVDTETMGLRLLHDPLCLIQVADDLGDVHLIRPDRSNYHAPNLKKLLEDKNRVKIFHYARFDLAMLRHYMGIVIEPVFCTKIASRLARTYTDRHGLKELCREIVGVDLSKQQQSSDWGAATLSEQQKHYAAGDVIYLHRCRAALQKMLTREKRDHLAEACFTFLSSRVLLDLAGWDNEDIFAH